jgi:hypothetical protein
MDHNEFDFMADLIRPFEDFIKRIQLEDDEDLDSLKPEDVDTIRFNS